MTHAPTRIGQSNTITCPYLDGPGTMATRFSPLSWAGGTTNGGRTFNHLTPSTYYPLQWHQRGMDWSITAKPLTRCINFSSLIWAAHHGRGYAVSGNIVVVMWGLNKHFPLINGALIHCLVTAAIATTIVTATFILNCSFWVKIDCLFIRATYNCVNFVWSARGYKYSSEHQTGCLQQNCSSEKAG